MINDEFWEKIKSMHEQLNDAFIAISGLHVTDMAEMKRKHDAARRIIDMRKTLDSMGLVHCVRTDMKREASA